MQVFAGSLQGGGEMAAGTRDGLMSVAIGLATTQSAREKRIVRISEISSNL
jgi:predicted dehydrogenase